MASVEQYRKDIKSLQKTNRELKGQIRKLQGAAEAASEKEIKPLRDKVARLEASNDEAKSKLAKLAAELNHAKQAHDIEVAGLLGRVEIKKSKEAKKTRIQKRGPK